jgi:hypothetical protein
MTQATLFKHFRPRGLAISSVLMILFGLAEVVTGFTHQFFELSTSQNTITTILSVIIGLLYVLGGILIIPLRKWGAVWAIVCLVGDIVGRIAMVDAGLYPLDGFRQTFAIIAGTLIAAFFAVYIGMQIQTFKN